MNTDTEKRLFVICVNLCPSVAKIICSGRRPGSGSAHSKRWFRPKAAGIEFNVGGNESIFYLSLWNRPNGERWHINVALFFDSAGNLYQTRRADSTTSLVGGNELADPQQPLAGGNPPVTPSSRI